MNTHMSLSPDQLRQKIIAALKTVYDPELPVNIYDLGLIYKIDVDDKSHVHIEMTLTTPNCPEAQSLPQKVEQVAQEVEGVTSIKLELVWDPPWDKDRMTDEVKMLLGIY